MSRETAAATRPDLPRSVRPRPRTLAGYAAAAAGAALAGVLSAGGFSVDDALIATRVAHHIASGQGYRFNADGPLVDCVTPLGWAYLLAPAAMAGAWQGLLFARWLGAAAWVAAAALLGAWSAGLTRGYRRLIVPLAIAACLPLGAWAVAGLETGVVLLLCTLALVPGPLGAAAAGVAAALRPELMPWALVLSFGAAWARRERPARWAACVLLALAPALAVAVIRALVFGRAAPLAVFAKPSDFEHGLRYTLGALAFSGPPYLLLAYAAWRKLEPRFWPIAVAAGVHAFVLVGVGGDWMPLWRLAVPVFPGLLLVSARLAEHSSARANGLRLGAVTLAALLLHWGKGSELRGVLAQRERLVAELPPLLDGARRIGTVDVGWVAAASGRHVVDLSGVTDENVAFLPGGHTSKRLPRDFLRRQDVDALVLLLAPEVAVPGGSDEPPRFWRNVEERVMRLEGAQSFAPAGRIVLTPTQDYLVLRRTLALSQGETIPLPPALAPGAKN